MSAARARAAIVVLAAVAGCRRADPPPSRPPADPAIRVTSMTELLAALRPGATIALAPGDYEIDRLPRTAGPHHRWGNVFEGDEYPHFPDQDMLVLEHLHDVTIRAERPDARPRLVTGIASATVLVLVDCTDVTLADLSLGHSVEGTCGGGVIAVVGGAGVRIAGCELSGSGTFGVEAYRTRDLQVVRSRIFHTSEGALRIHDTDGATITDTRIHDNTSTDSFVLVTGSPRVTLERLVIEDNHYTDTAVDDQALFAIGDSPDTSLRDTRIVGNTTEYFRVGDLAVTNVTLRDNTWVSGEVGH
jgi:hypothetical protein